jgi:hypothetical protein
LDKSSADIEVDSIFERPMHVMQAEDLTSENGNGFYYYPSFIVSAGLSFNILPPPKKPVLFIDISADLGLYAGVDLNFNSGIADTGVAVQTALQNSSSNEDLPCNQIVEAKEIESACTGNQRDYNNSSILRADEIEALHNDQALTLDEYNRITQNETLDVKRYGCEEPYFVAIYDENGSELKDPNDKNKTVRKEIGVIPCAEYGSCTVIIGNNSSKVFEGLTKKECEDRAENIAKRLNKSTEIVYTPYSCNSILRY